MWFDVAEGTVGTLFIERLGQAIEQRWRRWATTGIADATYGRIGTGGIDFHIVKMVE